MRSERRSTRSSVDPSESVLGAKQIATAFQRFWESEGLTVSASTTDFREKGGIVCSATADKDQAASAAPGQQHDGGDPRDLTVCSGIARRPRGVTRHRTRLRRGLEQVGLTLASS